MANKINIFKNKSFIANLFFAFFVFWSFNSKANDSTVTTEHSDTITHSASHEKDASSFDPKSVIFEHVLDAHEWHLWGDHHNAVSIPLPIILYSDKGIECFSSSVFHHGAYSGNYNYALIHNQIKVVDTSGKIDDVLSGKIMDFSITKNVASMFISVIILFWLFLNIASSYKKRGIASPRGAQSFIEPLIIFIRDDVAKPNIGPKAERFLPFLLTVFFFIWVNNLLGLLPGGANLTGNLAVTLVLSFITLIITNINGNKDYWKHILLPPVPWWLYPIMIPVELIGVISKPFALMIRLFANITAGHIIVISLISLIFIFKTIAIAPVSVAFVLFIDVLELLVAFLQAYIFTMLTALFIGTAVAEHEHHEHDHAHH